MVKNGNNGKQTIFLKSMRAGMRNLNIQQIVASSQARRGAQIVTTSDSSEMLPHMLKSQEIFALLRVPS
jgi:hypothetical protein